MISSDAVPWYNVPPRPFPAKVWLEQHSRYPFRVSPAMFAWKLAAPPGPARRFPALVWMEGQLALQAFTIAPG